MVTRYGVSPASSRKAKAWAALILDTQVPAVEHYRALTGLVNLARGACLFPVPERWLAALQRLPAEGDLAAWVGQEERLASVRGACIPADDQSDDTLS